MGLRTATLQYTFNVNKTVNRKSFTMSEILKIAEDFSKKIGKKEDEKLKNPEFQYQVFKKQVIKACEAFIDKDLSVKKYDSADELRGLLLNRIRTNLSNLNVGYSLPCKSVRNMYLGFTQGKTDVTSVRLFSHNFSNDEITSEDGPSSKGRRSHVDSTDRMLGRVFMELNKCGSMKTFVRLNSTSYSLIDSKDVTTPADSIVSNRYSNILLPYLQKSFSPAK
jgi:hypothetical protein